MADRTKRNAFAVRLRRVLAGTISLAAISMSGAAWAERGCDGPHHGKHGDRGPEHFIEHHADELELSDETRDAIAKIAEESRARARELREESRGDHEAFRALLEQPSPDRDAILERVEEMNERKLASKKNRLEAMLAIRALLTEEQREKLVEIRKSDSHHRRGHHAAHACREDVARVCGDAEPGQELLRCLADQWDDLSPECRESHERRGRWHRDHD